MDFLNVVLLGGAAALLAPLAIHLFNRQRSQIVDWGAMHLLQAALESNARRPRWESWWLLLVRCLIPVMLAFSLARPVLTHFKKSTAREAQAVLMIVDNSLSMAVTMDEESLLRRAQRELMLIADSSPGTEWGLWSNSVPATDLLQGTTFDLQRLRTALERTPPPAGSDLNRATLPLGLRQLSLLQQPGRQLILASDFQAEPWRDMSENELQAISTQLTTNNSATQLFLLPLRTSNAPQNAPQNVAVELLEAPSRARPQQPLIFVARISNYGLQEVNPVQVVFQVAGRDLSRRSLNLAPGGSEQVEFGCEFTELGWQHVSIRIDDAGDIHGDDVCYHTVQVTTPPQILVIDDSVDQPTKPAGASPADKTNASFVGTSRYLQLALAPFADPQDNPWIIQRIRSADIPESTLNRYAAVVVADVYNVHSTWPERLNDYVRGGGGLLCFANPPNSPLDSAQPPANLSDFLPLVYGTAQASASDQPAQLQLADGTFATSELERGALQGLNEFEFTKWTEMVSGTNPVDYRTLLRLQHGAPWLVEADRGQGLVVQCASSCGDQGSSLPNRPAYVPLMLSLVERVANHHRSAMHVSTGEVVQLRTTAESISTGVPSSTALVQRIALPSVNPDLNPPQLPSFTVPLQAGQGSFANTRLPGIYSAKLVSQVAGDQQLQPALFSVNVPAIESQLTALSDRELRSLALRLGATLIESATDYHQTARIQRDGQEVWRWLLWIVVGLLLAELWIGWRATLPSARDKSARIQ
jgi:hypothetical protein